jgi:hypothetical protein
VPQVPQVPQVPRVPQVPQVPRVPRVLAKGGDNPGDGDCLTDPEQDCPPQRVCVALRKVAPHVGAKQLQLLAQLTPHLADLVLQVPKVAAAPLDIAQQTLIGPAGGQRCIVRSQSIAYYGYKRRGRHQPSPIRPRDDDVIVLETCQRPGTPEHASA